MIEDAWMIYFIHAFFIEFYIFKKALTYTLRIKSMIDCEDKNLNMLYNLGLIF